MSARQRLADQPWAVPHCARCGFQTSVLAGTIFQDTKHDLRLWFRAIWYVTTQQSGVSALGLQRTLSLGSDQTAWSWLQKLRTAMVRPGRKPLTEEVEVDESYVGGVAKDEGKRHLGENKALVAIAAEVRGRGIGRIRLHRLLDVSGKSLVSFMRKTVARLERSSSQTGGQPTQAWPSMAIPTAPES